MRTYNFLPGRSWLQFDQPPYPVRAGRYFKYRDDIRRGTYDARWGSRDLYATQGHLQIGRSERRSFITARTRYGSDQEEQRQETNLIHSRRPIRRLVIGSPAAESVNAGGLGKSIATANRSPPLRSRHSAAPIIESLTGGESNTFSGGTGASKCSISTRVLLRVAATISRKGTVKLAKSKFGRAGLVG
jgi:hypothetical protein